MHKMTQCYTCTKSMKNLFNWLINMYILSMHCWFFHACSSRFRTKFCITNLQVHMQALNAHLWIMTNYCSFSHLYNSSDPFHHYYFNEAVLCMYKGWHRQSILLYHVPSCTTNELIFPSLFSLYGIIEILHNNISFSVSNH